MPRQATLATIPTWYNPRLAPPYPDYGQVIYDIPGTYYWTCPAGVVDVSVVCIGGGGSGAYATAFDNRYDLNAQQYYYVSTSSQSGGGGGGLGYRTFRQGLSGYNSPLVPGTTYTVVVGKGGYNTTTSWLPASGGTSYFHSAIVCSGGGGSAGTRSTTSTGSAPGGVGGGWYGDGGGNGGNGGSSYGNAGFCGGGGGAGGYGYNGGNGGYRTSSAIVYNGTNGFRSGSGGSGGRNVRFTCHWHDYKAVAGNGGGSNIFGIISQVSNTTYGGVATLLGDGGTGARDNGESYVNPADPITYGLTSSSYVTPIGKNTVNGVTYAGTLATGYGAGSGAESYTAHDGATASPIVRGNRGAVRIIWSGKTNTRYYPSTRIGDETTQPTI